VENENTGHEKNTSFVVCFMDRPVSDCPYRAGHHPEPEYSFQQVYPDRTTASIQEIFLPERNICRIITERRGIITGKLIMKLE
jgi:hypothetical protein